MKKILVLFMMMLIGSALFAQVQLGVGAVMTTPVDPNSEIEMEMEGPVELLYDAEVRLNLGLLEGSVTGIYQPGVVDQVTGFQEPGTALVLADVGAGLSLFGLVRAGVEAGLNYEVSLDDFSAVPAGVNLRALATGTLFGLGVGISATTFFQDFDGLLNSFGPDQVAPPLFVGLHLLLSF